MAEKRRYSADDVVVCAATGSVLIKADAVKVGDKWYRPEAAPGGAKAAPDALAAEPDQKPAAGTGAAKP